MLNYHNFQSYQRGNSDYPNMHARVTWNNGVETIQQMAVQFSSQNDPNDVFSGSSNRTLVIFSIAWNYTKSVTLPAPSLASTSWNLP